MAVNELPNKLLELETGGGYILVHPNTWLWVGVGTVATPTPPHPFTPRLISMEWTKCRYFSSYSSSSCQRTICKISLAAACHIHISLSVSRSLSLSLFTCLVHIILIMQQWLMFCRCAWFIASVFILYLSNSVLRKCNAFHWIFSSQLPFCLPYSLLFRGRGLDWSGWG
jgi:hypothetical protein